MPVLILVDFFLWHEVLTEKTENNLTFVVYLIKCLLGLQEFMEFAHYLSCT